MNDANARRADGRRCPICGKPAQAKHGAFCSARCQMIDLGRWLKGDYRVPTHEAPDTTPPNETEE
ncbi:MAG TPA: DNA gyrase inhibitor YacG [Stellaceae bacterium]|nr:DNA gyrase inhibitor YacG [Stellaceae bacterium]